MPKILPTWAIDFDFMSSNQENKETPKKKGKAGKIALIVIASIIAILAYGVKQAEKVHRSFGSIGFGN